MSQEISIGTVQRPACHNTQSLIRQAFLAKTTKRIIINPDCLDDETLSESERIAALHEIFDRAIRTRQIEALAQHMAPILGSALPQNLLIYGPSGSGKSVTCLHFLSTLAELCVEQGIKFQYFYVDLTAPKTCFGALNELAIALDGSVRRYRKGIAVNHMEEMVVGALSRFEGFVCIIIDEVDNVANDWDAFYTFLAKYLPRKVQTRLFYVFLTNRAEWEKTVDPRVFSVLKKMDMIFEPYDAMDLIKILNLRVEKALDASKVEESAIRKIAAYASRETGDARKAVELLVKAVKVAEEGPGILGEAEVDTADRLIEVNKTEELMDKLAPQQRLALKACYAALRGTRRSISTGHAYQSYSALCQRENSRVLTQRRFSDMVSFLDIYGLINARVISHGRLGKTRELSCSLPPDMVDKLIRQNQ
jgi:cell division control protein 6